MQYILSAEEMREYDKNTSEIIGIPELVLMERAALAACCEIEKYLQSISPARVSILIMSGCGNNGADGVALARMLAAKKYDTELWTVCNIEKSSISRRKQMEIVEHFAVKTGTYPANKEYTVVVDALFGIGLSRNVEGQYAEAIEAFNGLSGWKLALDIPSGINTDTGAVMGTAVKADCTITFAFLKKGLVLYPGTEYAGKIVVADIGISEESFLDRKPLCFTYDETVAELLPERKGGNNKSGFGKALIIAGDVKMAGAACLAAKAAYRVGTGMVKVISPEENRLIIQTLVPEALYGTEEDIDNSVSWAQVILIGPGLGKSDRAKKLLDKVIRCTNLPLVIDADGLNLLAEEPELGDILQKQGKNGRKIILTPHLGELSRLTGMKIADIKKDIGAVGSKLAKELHAIVAAKDARTYVCQPEGNIYINICGNDGMATAGSGDVLAGIIIGLIAQQETAFDAACKGVYMHAKAGDAISFEIGKHALTAKDMAEFDFNSLFHK